MTAVDGTAEVISTDLEPVEPASAGVNLFRTDNPVEVLARATEAAEALYAKLVEGKLIMQIGPSQHVRVEGWLMLGTMLGVTPVITWTRKLENGWEARCEARTMDGRTVGAGEAECLNTERNWKNSDDFQLRSMAQTRATAKALSGPLRFVVALAGLSGTPAEEMVGVTQAASSSPGGKSSGEPTDKAKAYLAGLLKQKKVSEAQLKIMLVAIGASEVGTRVKDGVVEVQADKLTTGRDGTCSQLIDWLKERPLPDPEHPSDVPVADDDFAPSPPPVDADGNEIPF